MADLGKLYATDTTETELWIDNDPNLYRRKLAWWANMERKFRAGKFDPKRAETGFKYLCDEAARTYFKEVKVRLDMEDRRNAAKGLVAEYLQRRRDADFARLVGLPPVAAPVGHATDAPVPLGPRAGARVEIPPHTDRWMMGDRYGTIVGDGPVPGTARVKLDKSGMTFSFNLSDLTMV